MLPNELSFLLLQHCDLESCLALGECSQRIYSHLLSLDSGLVRQKVLERVPWMELDPEDDRFDTWLKCARVIRARNRAIDKQGSKWTSGADLNSILEKCKPQEVFVDPQNVDGALPDTFEPVFDDYINCDFEDYHYYWLKGADIVFPGENSHYSHWNVKDLNLSVNHSKEHWQRVHDLFDQNPVTFGLYKKYHVRVMNETVAHLRSFDGISSTDHLAYKPDSGSNNDDGCFESSIKLPSIGNVAVSFVHLLPNNSSLALVGVHSRLLQGGRPAEDKETFIYLIDSNSPLKVTLVTRIPSLPIDWNDLFMPITQQSRLAEIGRKRDFDVTFYHGLLYIYCQGRLVPLWVDCGSEEPDNDTPFASDNSYLGKFPQYRVKTWFDASKSVICTVPGYMPNPRDNSRLIRKGRYVTVSGTGARLIGDLKTGTSYIARDRHRGDSFLFAGLAEDGVVFYRWSRQTTENIFAVLQQESHSSCDSEIIKTMIQELFDEYPSSQWEDMGCSDQEARLGVYRDWTSISRSGSGFNIEDIRFMVPNHRHERRELFLPPRASHQVQ